MQRCLDFQIRFTNYVSIQLKSNSKKSLSSVERDASNEGCFYSGLLSKRVTLSLATDYQFEQL